MQVLAVPSEDVAAFFGLIGRNELDIPVLFQGIGTDRAQRWCHPVMEWKAVIGERLAGVPLDVLQFSEAANSFLSPIAEDSRSAAKRQKINGSPTRDSTEDSGCLVDKRLNLLRQPNKMEEFKPHSTPMTFDQFRSCEQPAYVRWSLDSGQKSRSPSIPSALSPDVSLPPCFEQADEQSFSLVDAVVRMGVGQYTYPAHQDWASNMLLQISGAKRIQFHPPETPLEVVSGLKEAPGLPLIAALREGDLIFIPSNWWHAVYSPAQFNLSINYFFTCK